MWKVFFFLLLQSVFWLWIACVISCVWSLWGSRKWRADEEKVRVKSAKRMVAGRSARGIMKTCSDSGATVVLLCVCTCVCVCLLGAWLSQVLIKPSALLIINNWSVSICRDCCSPLSSLSITCIAALGYSPSIKCLSIHASQIRRVIRKAVWLDCITSKQYIFSVPPEFTSSDPEKKKTISN